MHRFGKYRPADSMSDMVSDNYKILLVMSRFGIGLGFGDRSIGEVCKASGVDAGTFLAVVNMLMDEDGAVATDDVATESLLSYLHNSHGYFLEFRLPGIRKKLIETVGRASELARAIINYFDEYVSQVDKHMKYEEEVLFPYVQTLMDGSKPDGYSIEVFKRQHDQVESRLSEFKQLLIKYYPTESSNEINSVLFDIFNCERDLASHNAVENRLLVPLILELEKSTMR